MLKPQRISCEGDHTGDPECLVDKDPKTVLTVPGKGSAIVYYDFRTPTEVRGLACTPLALTIGPQLLKSFEL